MAVHLEHQRLIYETRDYDRFTTLKGNRELREGHVKGLMDSMKLHGNLLDLYPLVVQPQRGKKGGDEFVIQDGQHRFEAASRLCLSIYYTLDGDQRMTLQTVIDTNARQESWSLRDYLSSYCVREFKEYLRIRAFLTKYPCPLSPALQLLCGAETKKIISDFKHGRYVVREWDFACRVCDNLLVLAQYYPGAFGTRWISAMSMLCRNPHFDDSRFKHKVPHAAHLITPPTDADEAFRTLQDVYNWKVQADNLAEFEMRDAKGRRKKAGRWIYEEQTKQG